MGFGNLKKCRFCGTFYSCSAGYYELSGKGNEYTSHLSRLTPMAAMEALGWVGKDGSVRKDLASIAASELEELKSRCVEYIENLVKDLESGNVAAKLHAVRSLRGFLNHAGEDGNDKMERKKLARSILANIKKSPGREKVIEIRKLKKRCVEILRK